RSNSANSPDPMWTHCRADSPVTNERKGRERREKRADERNGRKGREEIPRQRKGRQEREAMPDERKGRDGRQEITMAAGARRFHSLGAASLRILRALRPLRWLCLSSRALRPLRSLCLSSRSSRS